MAARITALMSSLCLLGLFLSCAGGSNSLRGSIGELYSLEFETVEVRLYDGLGIQILYSSPIAGSLEKQQAVDLFVDNTGISISEGIPIDLTQHGTLTRFMLVEDVNGQLQEDRRTFPAMMTGQITFHGFTLTPGETIAGQFEIIFISGDTLLGDFSAPLAFGDAADL